MMLLMCRFLQLFLLVLCAGGALAQCRRVGESSVYVLPNHFVGNVLIAFNQPDGTPAEYRNGNRLYRIPASGILRTQFKPNYGLHQPDQYFYVDEKGITIRPLPYIIDSRSTSIERQPTDTVCFRELPVTDSKTPRGHYSEFSIGRVEQLDSLYELRSGMIRKL